MIFERYLQLQLPQHQSLFLWGARKTGKSTFLKQRFPKSVYYDFLKHDDYLHYARNPSSLRSEVMHFTTEQRTYPIIIDEVQKIPEILDEVHWMIENIPGVYFILCGSSLRKLKHTGANLLGGRAWRQVFLPFVYPELTVFDLLRIFNHGLIPSHYLSGTYPNRALQGYLVDYLIPEIQWESRIRQMGAFQRFLEAAAFSNGQVLNYTNIARECAINKKTVQAYFELLVEMFIGYRVYPFAARSSRQLIVEAPKFYFFDPGIANFLLKRKIQLLKGAEAGQALEQYVFLELLAFQELHQTPYNIHYWRTKSGLEVDFVLNQGKVVIEVKISNAIARKEATGLLGFAKEYKPEKLILVCLEPRPRFMQDKEWVVQVMPIEYFLKELWAGKIL